LFMVVLGTGPARGGVIRNREIRDDLENLTT
jgi:hypothetical protein